jgi:hypothetical protein
MESTANSLTASARSGIGSGARPARLGDEATRASYREDVDDDGGRFRRRVGEDVVEDGREGHRIGVVPAVPRPRRGHHGRMGAMGVIHPRRIKRGDVVRAEDRGRAAGERRI